MPKGQTKMDNPEKLAIYGTQDTRRRHTRQKHNTIWDGHHSIIVSDIILPNYK